MTRFVLALTFPLRYAYLTTVARDRVPAAPLVGEGRGEHRLAA